jgi:hypothetical protein
MIKRENSLRVGFLNVQNESAVDYTKLHRYTWVEKEKKKQFK